MNQWRVPHVGANLKYAQLNQRHRFDGKALRNRETAAHRLFTRSQTKHPIQANIYIYIHRYTIKHVHSNLGM